MRYRRLTSALALIGLLITALILGSIAISDDPPHIIGSRPANNEADVRLCESISVDVYLPPVTGNGVDASTLNSNTVYLYRTSDGPGQKISANLNTTGGGDAVTLTPILYLSPVTQYTFVVTSGLKDLDGSNFDPFTMSFTTGTDDCSGGSPVGFQQIVTYQNENFPSLTSDPKLRGKYSSLAIGPDGRLYASMITATVENGVGDDIYYPGGIRIFEIRRNNQATDGLLKFVHEIEALNNRSVVGLEFDPDSTPTNPILWVTSNTQLYYPPNHPNNDTNTNFSGEIVRLTVDNFGQPSESWDAEIWIDGLPRSKKDHLANSLELGPDGKLYMPMGSQSAMGAPDNAWANRPESILAGAVLRIDIQKMKQHVASSQLTLPLHVSTQESGATSYNLNEAGNPYNPTAPGAYVQIFATGVRNAYDLVWHTNGQLYVPTNGSAAGGNSPAYSGNTSCNPRVNGQNYNGSTSVPALSGVSTQKDYLFRVVQGKYYGHPNPTRCEWVLNGGDSGSTPVGTRIDQYPGTVNPDPNYAGISWDMGYNKSPNGAIEYRSAVFGGALLGKLMVVRYSANNDILVLTPGGANKDIIAEEEAITGFIGFNNPLDLVEDTTNGNIYLSEYQDETDFEAGRIVLLKPDLNRRPVAASDFYVTAMNTPLSVVNADGVLKNDIDADGDNLTAMLETQPSHHVGTFILKSGGGFDYTPEPGFLGVDTFYYYSHDGQGNSNLGSVTISVTDGGPNEPPVANNDSYGVNENQTLVVNVEDGVLDNDTDPNGDFLIARYVEDSGPTHGTLTFNTDGSFTYNPVQAYTGTDSFEYRADDNRGGKNKATVTITVNEFNYPPEVASETYYFVQNEVSERDVTRGVLKNDTDSNLDPLTATVSSGPSHEASFTLNLDGSFSYEPVEDYLGLDSFTYTVSDGEGGFGVGIATINVVEEPLEFELLVNGRLEDKKVSNPKQPANWVAKALYNDKVVCNKTQPTVKVFSFEGDCAFKFVGNKNSPQLSYLQQIVQSDQLEKGDTLTLSAFVKGSNVVNNAAFIKVTVKYMTGKNDNFKLKIPKGTYPYTPLTTVIQLNQNRQVDTIKTRIIYTARGVSGNYLIDGVSLWKESSVSIPPDTLRGSEGGLIPLPPAPQDLRGTN